MQLIIYFDDDWTHFRAACYLHCAREHALGNGRTFLTQYTDADMAWFRRSP